MKRPYIFSGYLLIGIGAFFLLRQLKVPIVTNFYSWTTLLIIIGVVFLIHSIKAKDHNQIFTGVLLLGIGIHLHGMEHYSFWIDHWAVYPLIVGIAFLARVIKTKEGFLLSFILIGLSLFMIFSFEVPSWFAWIYTVIDYLEQYWPIVLIVIGVYLLLKKK